MSDSSAAAPEPKETPGPAGPTGSTRPAAPGDNGRAAAAGATTPGATTAATATAATAAGIPGAPTDAAEGEPHPLRTARTLTLALAVGSFALFWWVGSWLGIPREYGFSASLLQQPGAAAATAMVVAILLFFGCAVAAHLIAGRQWLYAGPFVAAVGLAAWSYRGGPSRYVYFHAADAGMPAPSSSRWRSSWPSSRSWSGPSGTDCGSAARNSPTRFSVYRTVTRPPATG